MVAKVAIPAGLPLSLDMLGVKVGEPKGIPPEEMEQLVGRMLKDGADLDSSITASMILSLNELMFVIHSNPYI